MGRRWLVVSIILVLTAVLECSLLFADTSTDKIISGIEAKAAVVKSYRADMVLTMEMMGKKMASKGKVIFKKPDKMWMEMNTDMGTVKMKQVQISNGKTAWTYQPMMKMATKIDIEKVRAEAKKNLGEHQSYDISKPFHGFKQDSLSCLRTDKIDGKKVYVFEGFPRQPETAQMKFAPVKTQIWIGADDGIHRKMIMFNDEGKEMMSQSYTNIEVNIKIADSQFEFTPPEGVQIMDMTEGSINMMKEMKEKEE